MSKLSQLVSIAVLLLLAVSASAQVVCPNCGRIHSQAYRYQTPPAAVYYRPPQQLRYSAQPAGPVMSTFQRLAQAKANMAARMGHKGHVGGSLGGANYEGVGYSSASAQQAINVACYSGHPSSAKGPGRPRLGVGVARGRDGWYACLLYR